MPVTEKFWQQHQLWDGTYTLGDFLDIVEVIQVKAENEKRMREHDDAIRNQA